MNEDTAAGEETGEEEGQYVFSESYDDEEAEIRKLLWYHIERTKKYVMRHILKIGDVASRVTIMENIFRLLFTHASDRKMNVESSTTSDGNGNEHEDSRLLRKRKKNNRRKKRGSSSGNDGENNHGHQQHSDSKAIDLQQSMQSSVDGASSAAALAVKPATTSSTASVSLTPVSPSTSLHSPPFSPSSTSSTSSSATSSLPRRRRTRCRYRRCRSRRAAPRARRAELLCRSGSSPPDTPPPARKRVWPAISLVTEAYFTHIEAVRKRSRRRRKQTRRRRRRRVDSNHKIILKQCVVMC